MKEIVDRIEIEKRFKVARVSMERILFGFGLVSTWPPRFLSNFQVRSPRMLLPRLICLFCGVATEIGPARDIYGRAVKGDVGVFLKKETGRGRKLFFDVCRVQGKVLHKIHLARLFLQYGIPARISRALTG